VVPQLIFSRQFIECVSPLFAMIRPRPACCRRLVLVFVGCVWAAGVLRAQDRLVFKDRHVEEGKIAGMSNGAVVINVAAGQVSYNLSLLSRVEAAPPPAFQTGYAAYEAGDWDKALASLKPVADQFKGLPTEWASQALAALGDVYIEKDQLPQAVATFNEYRTLYPGGAAGSLRMNLAQARIAFAQNDFVKAEKQLLPLRDAALKHPAQATRAEGAAYGQTCYLLGRLEERQGNYPAALVDYLRTVTLFYEDGAVTGLAEKSADALRAAHPGVSAP
jgi:tetratricopeptide (TPR) repeat protein